MKKSFAENCIRYISTATALILALAMLCCANFSASAKTLGSNLTITDTTSLLEDINTTTNTTPAKTKDLIASGAGVDVVSTGANEFNQQYLYVDLSSVSATMTGINHYWDTGCTDYYGWQTTFDSLGNSVYRFDLSQAGTTSYLYFRGFQIVTSLGSYKIGVGTDTTKNCVKMTSGTSGSWTTYSATTSYTVTFHANGHGTRPDAQTVTSGGKATVPTPPTAEGWTFVGWYTESSCTNAYDFDTSVTGNLDLYAKWTENASSDVSADIISVLKGEKIMFYIGSSYESGKTSAGIALYANSNYIDANGVTQGTINSKTHGYGYVTYVSGKYNITNNKNGGWQGQSMDTNSSAGGYYYIDDPSGHIDAQNADVDDDFTTVNNSTVSTSSTTGTTGISTSLNNLVYYLKSGDTYSQIATSLEDVNTYIESLADGNYTLYTCLSDGSITVLKDTDNFTKTSVVKYDVNVHYNGKGGTDYTSKIEENKEFAEPENTGVSGYTLEGWYTTSTFDTGTKVTFPLTITGNTDLYANWTANKYTVSFDSQGGDNTPADMEVTYDGTYVGLPTAAGTKKGHTFSGWYTSATDGTKVTETTPVKITEPQTLYAHWTANIYNITYKSGTETLSGLNPTTYTYGDGATLPATATKEGYTFKGWYANEDLTGKPVTSISTDETEDKTFYAKWELNAFKHKYVFLDVSGCDWFYNNKCVGVVYFNNDNVTKTTTGYTEMTELFTDDSGYESRDGKAQHSKLLFAEVPSDTTKITFARHGSGDYNNNYNITNFGYSNFTTNNCFKITGGGDNDSSASGTWSEKTYNPVPIDFSVVGNGSVAFKNTVSPEITVSNGGTIYADKASTALKVKATPSENYEVSIFTINGENKLVSIADESVGGTVDVGTLGNTNTVEVTFKASANPIVTIPTVEHSSVTFIYLDENGVRQTKENASGDYTVQFGSTITLNIIPDDGYYVKSVSDNLTPTDTLPKAGTITATATQVKEDLTVSYELAQNPKVTIDVPSNCTVDFTYINGNGVEATAHTAGTYSVYYGSNISYKVTPADDYYVASMTGVTTKTPTPPVAEAVTGTISNITADVADTITCTLNPNPTVTIECYDSTGTKIESGAGITVDGGTVALTKQSKSVLYNSETGVTFTASVDAEDVHQYRFLGYYTTKKPIGSPITSGGIDDYNVTVTEKSINIYRVTSDITLYAIFSQQYKVTFNYENLTNFTVDGTAVATGGSVYVSAGANLSLEATLSDDYKLTNDCWSITPTGVGTFAPNGTNASYTVGTSDVEITITPQIATYTGEGKWGSKILKIDTSGVGASKTGYDPWFAVSFKKSSTDTNDYFIRCSKVSDGLYECVIPDGYTHFDIYRMATGATAFTTEVESKDGQLDSTKAWNKTNSTTNIGTNTSYKLSYNGTVGQMSIATN